MTTTTTRFTKQATATSTLPTGTKTMNPIKSVLKDSWTIAGNLLNVAGTLSTTVTGELVKGSALMSTTIIDLPKLVKEVALTPVTATAAYIAEDNGTDYNEEEAKLYARLPNSMSEAYKAATVATARLAAQLMDEEV